MYNMYITKRSGPLAEVFFWHDSKLLSSINPVHENPLSHSERTSMQCFFHPMCISELGIQDWKSLFHLILQTCSTKHDNTSQQSQPNWIASCFVLLLYLVLQPTNQLKKSALWLSDWEEITDNTSAQWTCWKMFGRNWFVLVHRFIHGIGVLAF